MTDQFCPYCMNTLKGNEKSCPVCGCGTEASAQSHHLPVGTVLRSRNGHVFLFGMVKGEGGFGLTYIGKELGSEKLVAVKEYFPFRCQPQRFPNGTVQPQERFREIYQHGMKSFLSEASMLRAVCHIPSIVHVMDYFEANGTAYMVMEYLNGTTLYQVMQSRETISPEELIAGFLPLMHDLARLHQSGVVHRDIAPDNIMRMPDKSLRLLDFGCARSLEDGRSMTVVLKPGFAPLEQYQTKGQGPQTDIYALCATIYYCITGKVPPASPERLTAAFDNQPDPLLPPSALGIPMIPEQERLLLWGLSLQPSVRPDSMEELAARLEKAFADNRPEGGRTEEGNQDIFPEAEAESGDRENIALDENGTSAQQSVSDAFGRTEPSAEGQNAAVETRPGPGKRSVLRLVIGIAVGAVVLFVLLGILSTL